MKIKGFDSYEIFEDGRVWSNITNKFLRASEDKDGYLQVKIYKNKKQYTRKIHRLVAEHFIPNPQEKNEIHHDNHDIHDNNVSNLKWATRAEQLDLHWRSQQAQSHSSKPIRVFNEGFRQEYPSIREACRQLGLHHYGISKVLQGLQSNTKGYHAEYV